MLTEPDVLNSLRETLETKGIKYNTAEISMIPKTTVRVAGKSAQQALKLLELLEDHDDIQSVYSNFDIDDEEMAQLQAS
jgi:transcriptional/translational regulatory protein YebC/TACO1